MAVYLSFLLILTGLKGIHSISTISKVSVKAGSSVSIPCLYDSQYTNHVKYLCKGYHWSSCSCVIKTNQPSSGKFSISDDRKQRIFTVTIKGVTYQDTDYWCAVEINGGSDVKAYFHLSVVGRDKPSLNVENQQIKAFKGRDVTVNCFHQNSGEMKWCKLGRNCVIGPSGSIDGTRVSINPKSSSVFTVTMSGLKIENSGWYMCVKGDLQMPVNVTVDEPPIIRIHSISTISKVSVKAGTSISIPCLYDSQYTNHVKYLCKGNYWSFCSNVIKANPPSSSSRKFSISDDKKQRIFTVTIKDVTYQDTDYWCALDINGGSDVKAYFHLSVVRDRPSLNVENQQITAFKGGDVTINCFHQNSGEMKWCKLGRNCVTGPSGSIDGTRVSINSKSSSVFTVTMSGLKIENSGWYMCVKGDLQMPVNVAVDEPPTITNVLTTTNLMTVSTTQVTLLTEFAEKENGTFQDEQHSSPSISTSFIIRLSLLVLFLILCSFILFMVNRHKLIRNSSVLTKQQEKVRYVRKNFK